MIRKQMDAIFNASRHTIEALINPVDSKEFSTYATTEFIENAPHCELETIIGELSAQKKHAIYEMLRHMLYGDAISIEELKYKEYE